MNQGIEQLMSYGLTILVILLIFILVYCRMTGKSITDFFNEVYEIFKERTTEVVKK